jgi:hypothetical protein
MWKSIVAISVGASVGALLRWWLGTLLNSYFPTIPPGTLVANLVGGYVVGLAIASFAIFAAVAPEWRLLVVALHVNLDKTLRLRGETSTALGRLDKSLLVDDFPMRTGRSDSPRTLGSNFLRLPAMPGHRRHVAESRM